MSVDFGYIDRVNNLKHGQGYLENIKGAFTFISPELN